MVFICKQDIVSGFRHPCVQIFAHGCLQHDSSLWGLIWAHLSGRKVFCLCSPWEVFLKGFNLKVHMFWCSWRNLGMFVCTLIHIHLASWSGNYVNCFLFLFVSNCLIFKASSAPPMCGCRWQLILTGILVTWVCFCVNMCLSFHTAITCSMHSSLCATWVIF